MALDPDQEIRLACLKLALPDGISNPDAGQVLARAQTFAAFVRGEDNRGTALKEPLSNTGLVKKVRAPSAG